MTEENKKEIESLKKYILEAEKNLDSAKKALFDLTGDDLSGYESAKPSKHAKELRVTDGGKVIEGIFNGENMIGPEGKVFPVPANYASKSKLVEGDRLKLTVAEDGAFIFKQIGPVERKNLVGDLVFEDNAYHVNVAGKRYNLLYAAVTYHKAKPGDRVTIVVPAKDDSDWAAFENIIHNVAPNTATDESVSGILNLDTPEEKRATPTPTAPAIDPPQPNSALNPPIPAPDTNLDLSGLGTQAVPSSTLPNQSVPFPPPTPPIKSETTSLADATFEDHPEENKNSLGETIPGAAVGADVSDLEI